MKRSGFLPPGWKKKWKRWNNSYPWIPPRTGEWPENPKRDERKVWSKKMRRRNPMRQKPWNKVQRIEKFWTTYGSLANAPVNQMVAGVNDASQIVAMSGAAMAADQLGNDIGQRALQHVKVHRLTGAIWCWLAPLDRQNRSAPATTGSHQAFPSTTPVTPGFGAEVPPNIQMVNYVWLKLKAEANTPSNPGALGNPADFNPNVTHDWANLLERDDVISWGTIPVYGAVARMYTDVTSGVTQRQEVANPGQYFQNGVAKIPMPRIPKLGLNLRKGDWLMCYAATWNGPGSFTSNDLDDTTPPRGVTTYPVIRALCSI